jgi:formiminotetrahydrofolate cyclodeaminase
VAELLAKVASPEPAPGAGFVAGMTVSLAAGLVTMAARLSVEEWPEARGAAAQSETLRLRIAPLAERNAEAYAAALAALAGEQARYRTRDETLADTLAAAADVPLRIGDAAATVASLAADVAENGNASVRADCAVAASLAVAGARAAAALVEVNLGTTPGDERIAMAREHAEDASAALERALAAVA